MRTIRLVCLLLLALCAANAQYTSGLEGTVLDPSGAAVAGAHVSATNQATGVKRDTDANSNGYFHVPELAPGVYRVDIQPAGFQTWAETAIQVDANQLRTVYPKLAVGQQKAEIEVASHLEGIETGQSSFQPGAGLHFQSDDCQRRYAN